MIDKVIATRGNSRGAVRFLIAAIPPSIIRMVSRNQSRYPTLRWLCSWGASTLRNLDGVIQNGVGSGLRFNIGSSHSGFLLGTHKPVVQEFLSTFLRPGMVFYDAGANAGFYAIIAARLVGPEGSVVCFEPLPDNARLIEHNAQLNHFSHVAVRCEALGDCDRTERFLTSSESTWGRLETTGKTPDKHSGDIIVNVRKLDSARLADRLLTPNLIKIDVEGAEAELLRGAVETIGEARPVLIIELHGTNEAVSAVLDKLGYDAIVPEGCVPINEAHWNATVIAVPREKKDLIELMNTSANPITAR